MADLGERGQILLIAAFALAVTFVALALVVNSAIFTENLASRGEVSGSSGALVYQHQAVQSVGDAIGFANVYNYTSSGTLTNSLEESVSDFGDIGGNQSARGGQLVNVSFLSRNIGTRVADNTSGGSTFVDISAREDWQIAEDIDRARDIQITVTDDNLLRDIGVGDPFTLIANESDTDDDIWKMRLLEGGGLDEVVVEVETDSDSASCTIQIDSEPFDIDVTRGLVDGKRCHALARSGDPSKRMWFATGIPTSSTFNLSIENGHEIQGNFSMVIDGTANGSNLDGDPGTAGTNPFETQAIYDATIEYVYVTANVRYVTEIRVAPGEKPR